MNILFLSPQPFFEVRGTPINVRRVVTALGELGHDVDLVVYPHGEEVDIPKVRILRAAKIPGLGKAPIGPSKSKFVYDAFMFIKAVWMMLLKRYDVIHAVEESAFMARWLGKLFRVPYIFDMDSHISDQLRYSGFFKMKWLLHFAENVERKALQNAAAVVTVCPYLTDIANKIADPAKVYQVEDIPQDLPAPPEGITAAKLRADMNIPPGAPVALYTGNFEKYQGVDLLMEAIPEVIAKLPSAWFVIVGGDDARAAHYRAEAERNGVAEHLRFTGPQPLEMMEAYYEMADVLLSPRVDGTNTPLKIYTYLATGKPIVATDLPTHTQLLDDTVARLAPPEKMAFAEAILLLLKDKQLRETIGARGKAFVEKNYNYETFKRKIETVYRNL